MRAPNIIGDREPAVQQMIKPFRRAEVLVLRVGESPAGKPLNMAAHHLTIGQTIEIKCKSGHAFMKRAACNIAD
mgnify:CR=1 FL=1